MLQRAGLGTWHFNKLLIANSSGTPGGTLLHYMMYPLPLGVTARSGKQHHQQKQPRQLERVGEHACARRSWWKAVASNIPPLRQVQ
jgi:hypothetical protein